jgi:hypothetical protein
MRVHIVESIVDALAERRRRKLTKQCQSSFQPQSAVSLQYLIPQIPALYMNSMNI